MARYQQTSFPEDDNMSIGGINLSEIRRSRDPQSRYRTHEGSLNWRSRSKLEQRLFVLTLILTIIALMLFAAVVAKNWPQNNCILHIEPHSKVNEIPCLSEHCIFAANEILKSIDDSIDPCDDFYAHTCNKWIRANPIPEGKSTWSTFGKLEQLNQLIIRNILEKPLSEYKSEAEKKAKFYYESCLDKQENMEKLGAEPLIDLLKKIGGWNVTQSGFDIGTWSLARTLKILQNRYNFNCLFSWAVGEDDKNSSRHVIQIDQGGLALPTPDYYNNKTEIHRKVLAGYLEYMTRVCVLLGAIEPHARQQMEAIISFETKLANISIPLDERRNEEAMYHPMSLLEIQIIAPFLNWTEHFNDAMRLINKEIKSSEIVVVYAPDFLKKLSNIITEMQKTTEGKITLHNYMIWQAVRTLTSCLSKPFRDAYKYVRKALMGSDGGEEVWRYCVADTNNMIGFAVGAIFVRQAFRGESKGEAENMVLEIREAFKDNLRKLTWMGNSTREHAIDKANEITDMIGYPNYILNSNELDKKYYGLKIVPNQYFENNIQVAIYNLRTNLEKLKQLVDKTHWGMTPQMVNAYYTPTKNQIVFPAGILQLPFFDTNNPKSLNFGSMGVVMGHELTHAFDDQGREYDKFGNMHRWWDNKSIASFTEKTRCFERQYSNYKLNGRTLNGKQTLGENIADNGGLKAAYHAFLKSGSTKVADVLKLPGLNMTHKQLFFVSFAQVWCSSTTNETNTLQMEKDAHSPSAYRVIGTLSNTPEFSEVFNCKLNSKMNPSKKCVVW